VDAPTHPGYHVARGGAANAVMAIIDHWDCVSWDGGVNYNCVYRDSTLIGDDDPFGFMSNGIDYIQGSITNCQTDPLPCGSDGFRNLKTGPLDYSDSATRDIEPCDPTTDPNCERDTLTDTQKTLVYNAINYNVRNLATIQDTALRRRCTEMLQKFNVMLAARMVFVGDNDDPLADGTQHYAAYNPNTFNIHIDPKWLNNLNPASNNGWHVAASMLHEGAHGMGMKHEGLEFDPDFRGGTIIYDSRDTYFHDLNPGPKSSCLRYP
jgi:hypothetical protein